MRILVAGATGYVGSRLVPVLLAAGHRVRVGVRRPELAARMPWAGAVEVVPLDVRERAQARTALAGVDALAYLVHGLAGDDFAGEDRIAAETMATEAVGSGLARIVYLSGLVPDVGTADLSPHIASRLEVEQILTESGICTLSLRAGMILGCGSTSFEVLRQVSERLVLQPVPGWLGSRVQPIAVADVLLALTGSFSTERACDESGSRSYDIGGPEVLRYPELLRLYAATARLWRVQVRVPLVPSRVVGLAGGLLTDVPDATMAALVQSLRHDMVCRDSDAVTDLFPRGHRLLAAGEGIERALRSDPPDPMSAWSTDPDWTGGGRRSLLGRVAGRLDRAAGRLRPVAAAAAPEHPLPEGAVRLRRP